MEVPRIPGKWKWNLLSFLLSFLPFIFIFEQCDIWTLLTWDVSMVPLTYSISLIMLLLVSQSSMLPFASLKPPTAIKSFRCTTVREQKASVKVLRVLVFQAPWSNLSFFYLFSFLNLIYSVYIKYIWFWLCTDKWELHKLNN